MLYCYASELKGGFLPYVDHVAKIVVPLLKFAYHDGTWAYWDCFNFFLGVRQAAVSCASALLESAQGSDPSYVRNLFNFMFSPFLEGIQQEIDLEILALMLETFVEVLTSPLLLSVLESFCFNVHCSVWTLSVRTP